MNAKIQLFLTLYEKSFYNLKTAPKWILGHKIESDFSGIITVFNIKML